MAEVINYGVIKNAAFLQYLEENKEKGRRLDPETMQTIIYNCCAVKKASVVQQDRNRNRLRAISQFWPYGWAWSRERKGFELLHGECVALGMIGALKNCAGANTSVSRTSRMQYAKLLRVYGLPVKTGGVVLKMLSYMKTTKRRKTDN